MGKSITIMQVFALSLLWGNKAIADVPQDAGKYVDLIVQGLTRCDSIEYDFYEETTFDEKKTWHKNSKGKVIWDKSQASYRRTDFNHNSEGKTTVVERINGKDRCYLINWDFERKVEFEVKGSPLAVSALFIGPKIANTPIDEWENAYKSLDKYLLDLYKEKKITLSNFSFEGETIKLAYNRDVWEFDKKTGSLLSKTMFFSHKNEPPLSASKCELSNYVNIKGWKIPLHIDIVSLVLVEGKAREESRRRFTLLKDSVGVNNFKQNIQKFSFPIPKDIYVHDGIMGICYRSLGTDGAIPTENIAGELDAIFEEAEKQK